MSRRINAGFAFYNPGPAVAGAGALTLLMVIKNVSGTSWASLMECEAADLGTTAFMSRRSNGNLSYADSAGLQDGGATVAITATTTWWVVAITKATGSVAPVFHRVDVGGTSPQHATGTAATGGGTAAQLKLAGDSDPADILIAAAAVWVGTALSNANIETIATTATTQGIANLSPTWLVDDSDGLATDLIGTQDRTSETGGSDSADNPPGWVYGLGPAGTTYTKTGLGIVGP